MEEHVWGLSISCIAVGFCNCELKETDLLWFHERPRYPSQHLHLANHETPINVISLHLPED